MAGASVPGVPATGRIRSPVRKRNSFKSALVSQGSCTAITTMPLRTISGRTDSRSANSTGTACSASVSGVSVLRSTECNPSHSAITSLICSCLSTLSSTSMEPRVRCGVVRVCRARTWASWLPVSRPRSTKASPRCLARSTGEDWSVFQRMSSSDGPAADAARSANGDSFAEMGRGEVTAMDGQLRIRGLGCVGLQSTDARPGCKRDPSREPGIS
ncbi:hypothetical protein GALL_430910 [mine drainage metagenome]|uniref:Uncharacterized protein n=1 Tax=mine drainage metagenome TaxID=410659 RepID=A0A1J5Q5S7_9ZZZZ